jgi:predicted amidohydrolase YtcJ
VSRRPPAELIIEGRVATLGGSAGFGWQAGLAIAGGQVVACGSARDLDALSGPATVRWRLGAELAVMPGITDAHLHLLALVVGEGQLDLGPAGTLDATLALLGEEHRRRTELGDDGWLLGHGWLLDRLGGWPDADMLQRACPGRPVALYSHDHHTRWVSHAALRAAGIDGATADPEGGLIRRLDGAPSGILHETAASLVDHAIPPPMDEQLEASLRRVAAGLAAEGITGCHDPGELDRDPSFTRGPLFYRRLAEKAGLPLRVHASIRAPQLERAIELGLRSGEGIGRYTMGWLKLFADGSLGSRSAALLEPYEDAATHPPTGGPAGMFLSSADELRDALVRAAQHGICAQVHAIGDGAVRTVLDVLADVPAGRLARRVEHAQLVDPADVPRFGRLAVAASVQPIHLRSDADQARSAWGARSENAFPIAALAGGGALIPFGTDAPVEPSDPWPGIAVAVCRRDPFEAAGQPLGPQHALSLERSVRAACLDPALVAGVGDLGRLLPGYRADLIVVAAHALVEPIDPALLASTRPLATMIDGEVIHQSPDFDP